MQHCFSDEAHDTLLHFQVVDLGRQLYVWVGGGGGAADMGSLTLAASPMPRAPPAATAPSLPNGHPAASSGSPNPSISPACITPSAEPARALPAATMLLRGGGGGAAGAAASGAGASLARRLALRLGRPVAVAWGLPGGAPELAAAAERRLLQELGVLQLAQAGAGLQL